MAKSTEIFQPKDIVELIIKDGGITVGEHYVVEKGNVEYNGDEDYVIYLKGNSSPYYAYQFKLINREFIPLIFN